MSTRGVRVLVVDDDRAVRSALKVNLQKAEIQVTVVRSAEEALEILQQRPIDLLLTDVRMPGLGGLELLERTRARWPQVEVVIMTGYGNVEDAVNAMKQGAADYIIKPISKNELLLIIERALEARALRNEVVALRQEVKSLWGLENIIGSAQPMLRVYEQVHSVASTSSLVLLQGETGTGKELVARAIHLQSRREKSPFLRVNCAALPDTLLESELFGHERGAFTGAIRHHQGKFEQANNGTMLLDEIGDISPAMQVKLLHVLENGEFQRLGGQETVKVDVRVIAATNRELRTEVQEGRFRKDLFYRLNVFSIQLPPLRDRKEDIPALVSHFIQRYAARTGRPVDRINTQAMRELMSHSWPGNVRELEHVIERAIILSTGNEITSVDIGLASHLEAPSVTAMPALVEGVPLQDTLHEMERHLIVEALRLSDGVQAQAARKLGISRSNLHYRIHKLGIELKDLQYT